MKRVALLAWATAAALLCWRLDPLRSPLTADTQLYFYMAERAASGVPPHVSHVDSKNDLGVLVTAAAIAAGRPLGIDDVDASRAVSIAFGAASVALAAELGALIAGSAAAGHVAALALLACRGFVAHAAYGNDVKIFLAAFLLAAHVAMSRSRGGAGAGHDDRRGARLDAVAGAMAGAAFAVWQPALLVIASIVFEALVARGGGPRRALRIAASAVLPFAACELWFAWKGALREQLFQTFVMASGSMHDSVRLLASTHFLVTEAGNATSPWRVVPASFAFALAGAAALALVRPRRAIEAVRSRPGLLSFWLSGLGATAFTIYDHQGVPDLFFPDPYYAVGVALLATGAASALAVAAPAWKPRLERAACAVAALLLVQQMRGDDEHRWPPPYDLDAQRRLAGIVRVWTEQPGSVWVYGAVHLLGLAHADNHVPYGLFYGDVASVLDVRTYRPLRDGRMPELIVYSRGELPGSSAWLEDEYADITPPAFAAEGAMVWLRTSPQPGASGFDWRDPLRPPSLPAPAVVPKLGAAWERATPPRRRSTAGRRAGGEPPGTAAPAIVAPAAPSDPTVR